MKIKKAFNILIFVFIFLAAFFATSFVMRAKEPHYKNKEFIKETEEFDVLFFGSSHSENFFDPLRLWKKYGITSYNFGNPEEPIPVTYWLMKNAINKNKPKLVVMDLFMFNRFDGLSYDDQFHYALDAFPVNSTKIEAISDLSDTKEDFAEKIFTIGKYHSRWKRIGKDKKTDIKYFMKGCLSYGHPYTMNVVPFEEPEQYADSYEIEDNNIDAIYLNKMLELCNDEAVDILFVATPFCGSETEQVTLNSIEKYLSEKGAKVLDYNKLGSVIDMSIDLYNVNHVNQSGMRKVTEFIGSYISENYNYINNQDKSEKCREKWDRYYSNYIDLKKESLWAVDSLDATLMLLHDEDFKSYIYINNKEILSNKIIYSLLNNIVRNDIKLNSNKKSFEMFDLDKIDIAIDNNNSYMLISNEGEFKEYIGDEAEIKIANFIDDYKTADGYIVVKDSGDSTFIIKEISVSDNLNSVENKYIDITPKYIF